MLRIATFRLPRLSKIISLAVGLGLVLLLSLFGKDNNAATTSQSAIRESGEVVYVTDGDTVKVLLNGIQQTVRLIGIDTPEVKDPRKPVQCFGREASQKTTELLLNKKVVLESDSVAGDKDKYNRLLRYVFLEDGTNVNKKLIADGYAYEYTYESQLYKYRDEFKSAEKDARLNKRGLWADGTCAGVASPVQYKY